MSNKEFNEPIREAENIKDSPTRSLVKALSYRLMALSATFLIGLVIFRQFTDKTLNESMEGAGMIAVMDFVLKLIIYYLHERLWTNISWGKYWQRDYWQGKARKRTFRRLRKKVARRMEMEKIKQQA
ncbi:MAG TPA: DUF2061 domain-containing protein [Bacteroidales bacterium]|nr:DUF2061 domain-containing protein [Bacteroidales bacterium]